jgi:hypothetical protein
MFLVEVVKSLVNAGLLLDKYLMAEIKAYKKILKNKENR